jgi:hypothetical protein
LECLNINIALIMPSVRQLLDTKSAADPCLGKEGIPATKIASVHK